MAQRQTRAAAKRKKLFFLAAVYALLSALLAPTPALARRTLPDSSGSTLAPQLPQLEQLGADRDAGDGLALIGPEDRLVFATLTLLDDDQVDAVVARQRHELHLLSADLARAREAARALKTATGVSTSLEQNNFRGWRHLRPESHRQSYQGLCTDPTTGLSYARNRWYEARTASWLSEDPLGPVDSPNLYSAFGWNPSANTDPLGALIPRDRVIDPDHWLYRYKDRFYQVTNTEMVVELIPGTGEHRRVRDPDLIRIILEMTGKSVSSTYGDLHQLAVNVNQRIKPDDVLVFAEVYWGACATPIIGGGRLLPHVLGLMSGTMGVLSTETGSEIARSNVEDFLKNYWFTALFSRLPLERLVRVRVIGLEEYSHAIRLFASGFMANISLQIIENYERGVQDISEMDVDVRRAIVGGLATMEGGVVFRGTTASKRLLAEALGSVTQIIIDFLYERSDLGVAPAEGHIVREGDNMVVQE